MTSASSTSTSSTSATSGSSGSETSETDGESSSSGPDETGSSSSDGSSSSGSAGGAFDEPRTYAAFWPSSQDECDELFETGVTNCYYTVTFCPDGSSAVVWTDIVGAGTYTLDGLEIEGQWEDVRFSPVSFVYDPDTDTLEDALFNETWERELTFSLIDC